MKPYGFVLDGWPLRVQSCCSSRWLFSLNEIFEPDYSLLKRNMNGMIDMLVIRHALHGTVQPIFDNGSLHERRVGSEMLMSDTCCYCPLMSNGG